MDDDFDENLLMEAADRADKYLKSITPKPVHIQCLQTNFGHTEFRPKQWDIIRSIIEEKRDNCVIMPTGYGKSLCFQYPAVFTNGITLVISPLISLMQDQVRSMRVTNISACFLGSAQTDKTIVGRVIAGEFRLVYASPEYISGSKEFLIKLEKKLTLIAIDEAHAISQWGHDFRTDYRKLGEIRKIIPSVPILCVTATATPNVRDDMVKMLHLKNPQILCMGFDRPNLHFSFKVKTKDVWFDLKPFVTQIRGSVIIYVLKKAISEDIAKILRQNGVTCEIYHAGLPGKKRRDVLEDFTMDRLQVIVATVAFGMGIDKPDVRCVIHYGASKNIETYYQEVGRAGRDGLPSKVITFYDDSDFHLHEWFLTQNHEHKSASCIQHMREIGAKMKDFCYSSNCRRKFLLEYFGSDTSNVVARSNCCDNCDRGSSSLTLSSMYERIDDDGFYDFTQNGYLLLRAMQITSKSSVAIPVLRGSCEKNAMNYKHEKEIFGAGKIWPKEYWMALMQQLKSNDYLTMKPMPLPYRPFMILSTKAYDWLRMSNRPPLKLKANPEMYKFFVKKRKPINNNIPIPATSTQIVPSKIAVPKQSKTEEEDDKSYQLELDMSDQQLEEILLGIRTILAEKSDCMPYFVASNIAIKQMVEKKPVSVKEFKEYTIDGFSVAKIEKFANLFIAGIIKFLNNDFSLHKILQGFPLRVKSTKLTSDSMKSRLQKLINDKKSIEYIQKELNLTESETIDELVILIRTGCPIQKTHLYHLVGLDEEMFAFIKNQTTDEDLASIDSLSEIKEKFCTKTRIDEKMLNLALNYLKVRQLMTTMNVPYFDIDENKLMNGNALLESNYDNCLPERRVQNVTSQSEMKNVTVADKKDFDLKQFEYKAISSNSVMEHGNSSGAKLEQWTQNVNPTNSGDFKRILTDKRTQQKTTNSIRSNRITVRQASKVVYENSSDSDSENEPEIKRKATGWICTKKT